jgi:hypothetical protein
MARPRSTLLTISVVCAALVAVACGTKGSPDATATTTPDTGVGVVTPEPTETTATTTPATSTAPPAPGYPDGARQYAEAVLAAWKAKALQTLANLATAQVHEQIIEIPMPVNMNWHYSQCDGAAGSTYCTFFNDPGDKFVLKLTNALLGKPHAAVGVQLDQTEYPSSATAYVKAFIAAWQEGNRWRMLELANQAEVDYFTHYTPPAPGYLTCNDGAAGSTYVRVYNADGLNYAIRVINAQLSKPHAITGHVTPPASCP